MTDPTAAFQDLKTPGTEDEYYPGSKQRKRDPKKESREKKEAIATATPWDARPLKRSIRGTDVEVFPIGALGKALDKKPVTLRKWITNGWMPDARYRTKPALGTRGDKGRRLWTREQIELIRKIATEEGIVGTWHPDIPASNFTQRIRDAWRATYVP
jgi:hypothetical protein